MLLLLTLACSPSDDGADKPHSSRPDSAGDSGVTDSHGDDTHTGDTHGDDTHTGDTHTGDSQETGDSGATGPTPALVFTGARPTNLLVISLDTTRRDQLGVFSGLDTTPFWDGILSSSVLLADHRSCSNWTAPSMICATTSRFPVDDDYWPTSVYNTGDVGPIDGIPDDLPTLASVLVGDGYTTHLVTGNGVFSPNNCPGIVNGYQEVLTPLWQGAPDVAATALPVAAHLVAAGDPWFLHIHFIDPHNPYVAPAEYDTELAELDAKYHFPWDISDPNSVYTVAWGWSSMSAEEQVEAREYLLALYRAELRYWDASIEALWRQLDSVGALDDTLVVFWTDHGESHGEHGAFFHGVTMNAQENRSTAAFWARNLAPVVWEGPTIHQDIVPTVLDAMGLPEDPDATGTVVGLAREDRVRFGFNFLRGYSAPILAATRSQHQVIYYFTGGKYYYDLTTDPEGDVDRYDPTDPEVVDLWSVLGPEVNRITTQWPSIQAVDPRP